MNHKWFKHKCRCRSRVRGQALIINANEDCPYVYGCYITIGPGGVNHDLTWRDRASIDSRGTFFSFSENWEEWPEETEHVIELMKERCGELPKRLQMKFARMLLV